MKQTLKNILDEVQKLYDDIDYHKDVALGRHDVHVWRMFQRNFKKDYIILESYCKTITARKIIGGLFQYYLITSMEMNNYFEIDKYFN